ncbi:hypothetical protein PV327_003536 [Microctonus hyperodae]|uniref:Uncharacterized protein n=1 Tax=Microctonus hyperodae TaxID=165561 RepID=A0AA39G5T5_MICHY|nr:hypothetical protein PV327_003536 [Microctonus hyperodae]
MEWNNNYGNYVYRVPEGLRKLCSDISREVLRTQPKNIYCFIADYVDDRLSREEKKKVAMRIVNDVSRDSEFIVNTLHRMGLNLKQVASVAPKLQYAFRSYLDDIKLKSLQDIGSNNNDIINKVSLRDALNSTGISLKDAENTVTKLQQTIEDNCAEMQTNMVDTQRQSPRLNEIGIQCKSDISSRRKRSECSQPKIAASSLANHHKLDACAHAAHCGIQVLRHRFECQVKLIDEFANVTNQLKESINQNIDPCEDFVEFACGNQFKKFNKMNKDKNNSFLLKPTTYRLHLWHIRRTLQKELSKPLLEHDSRGINLAKIFWITADDALKSVRILLKRLGGWPVITESWHEEHFSWDKFNRCARRLGFMPRMFIHVGLNVDNVRKPWHPNDTINLTIEKPKYFYNSTEEQYNSFHNIGVYTIAEFISEGVDPTIAHIDEALTFGRKLLELDCAPEEKKSEIMSIMQLQNKFPIIDWFKHIKAMMKPRQAKYLSDYNCIIVDVCYVSAFGKFIMGIDKKIQANYGLISIIDDLFSLIRPQIALAFSENKMTTKQICFDATAAIFRKALDVIIGRAPDPSLITTTNEIENRIYNQTLHIFHTIPWMDEETRLIAKEKLDSTVFERPFPDDILNRHYFSRVNFNLNTPFPIILREINIFLVDSYYLQAGRPKNQYGLYQENERVMRALFHEVISPNAASVKSDIFSNKIYMPAAAILHRQLSIIKELDFINYASIGVQLGQALSHRIYQKGACVDAMGTWHMNSWWSITTQKQFMSRQSCHAIGPVKPIADASTIFGHIGGVEIAYMAMFTDCITTKCHTTLNDLDFNTRQLFWISYVASDCDRDLKYRYNTILSNNNNFSIDFQCPVNSKMHTRNKCKMWI